MSALRIRVFTLAGMAVQLRRNTQAVLHQVLTDATDAIQHADVDVRQGIRFDNVPIENV